MISFNDMIILDSFLAFTTRLLKDLQKCLDLHYRNSTDKYYALESSRDYSTHFS